MKKTFKKEPIKGSTFMLNSKDKKDILRYYQKQKLSFLKKRQLKNLLLQQKEIIKEPSNSGDLKNFLKIQKPWALHAITALCSTTITAVLCLTVFAPSNPKDLIVEVATLANNNNSMPADFNLDGNLNDLPELILDSLPKSTFLPSVPKQIAKNYSAYEGRFFLLEGQQGVSIQLKESSSKNKDLSNETLYIVKLSQNNISHFPEKKINQKIKSENQHTSKLISTWREGVYGYAMVKSQKLNY